MPTVRALITIPMDSGLLEDAATNTLYFEAPLVDQAAELTGITTALTSFYQAVDVYLSARCNNPVTVRYYDLSQAQPRVPLREDTMTLTFGTGDPLPQEVALCLSFQGAKSSGVNQARRRGRIYLGPLDRTAAGSTVNADRPHATALSTIATAATALATAAFGNGTPWVVYSPSNNASTSVTDGWLDNAFDTQRRRGLAPTSRTLWT